MRREAAPDAALRQALYIAKEHRLCGSPYEGCYSHFSFMDHCRADGMKWPCDVEAIRAALPTPPAEEKP